MVKDKAYIKNGLFD